MNRTEAYRLIDEERAYQDKQWGGTRADKRHSIRDWTSFMMSYLGRAVGREADWGRDYHFAKRMFVKVAALCVAALEALD
jgi:hypothetical protein